MNLSTTLRANAAFTAICAGLCLVAADWVAAHTALPAKLWATGLGAMLGAYVPMLLFAARRPMPWLVKTIIALDWGFVAIASLFLATHWTQIDVTGIALITSSTALVGLFAWVQMCKLAAMRWVARV
jgi:hypothetical protein